VEEARVDDNPKGPGVSGTHRGNGQWAIDRFNYYLIILWIGLDNNSTHHLRRRNGIPEEHGPY
jgi:hypothetical protein